MATLQGQFDTRRQAEMAVERMVQEYHVDRAAIEVMATGSQNSVGREASGSDSPAVGEDGREDEAKLAGAILIRAEVADSDVAAVRAAFREFDADPA